MRCAILLGAIEAVGFESRTYRIAMQVQLRSDGADLPVFGKEQKTDFCHQFRIDHDSPAGAEDFEELSPASAHDAKEAVETLLSTALVQILRFR